MISKIDAGAGSKTFRLLIPVFNDWEALAKLLQNVETVLRSHKLSAEVCFVDDGSKSAFIFPWHQPENSAIREVKLLRLRRNLGHQRALAIGLAHLEQLTPQLPVVVMDGDGEDSPQDIPRLLAELENTGARQVIFAERTLRSEGPVFRFFYQCYRLLHGLLVGRSIRFGNFSVIPPTLLHELVIVAELWNHYAASIIKARLPYSTIPTNRSKRLMGQSKMNFADLVTHGMSALSVFGELVVARLLVAAGLSGLSMLLLIVAGVAGQFIFGYRLPLSVVMSAIVCLFFCLGSLVLSVLFSLQLLQSRVNTNFIPAVDYQTFIDEIRNLWPIHAAAELQPRRKSRSAKI